MGLSLEVGILADCRENDPEAELTYRGYFETLNNYLESLDMAPHHEPLECEIWSAQMYGYSGLHYLRRFAAYVDSTGQLPVAGDDNSSKDPVLESYFNDFLGKKPRLISRIVGRLQRFARNYDHLIIHSDAEGFYLPADFEKVLIVPNDLHIPGGMVGSAHRLLDELWRLSKLLGIPDTLHSQSDALWEAAETQGEGHELWQRYGIESFSCVVLREGCEKCLGSGAALVFT